jgi:hypothetical protein
MSSIEDKLWEHLVEHHEADRARVRARTTSRAPKRPVAVGIAATGLAAVGVAAVLATSSGSNSTAASGPTAGGSTLLAPTGPARAQDTAYIIKRVKAKVADDLQGGTVIHSYNYASGDANSDGSLVNLGQKTVDGYEYTAADGTVSFRTAFYDQTDGSLDEIAINDLSPDGTGKYDDSRTIIDPGNQTYSQDQFPAISDPNATSTPNLFSSPSEVQQALQTGQVTQNGAATVNGTQAITLSVKVPIGSSIVASTSGRHTVSTDLTLYVDAQTYQPLRTVLGFGGVPGLLVADWVPATPENITMATDGTIPSGYTKVNDTH